MKFLAGLIFGMILAAAVPLALIATGNINMAATERTGAIERQIGLMSWRKSVEKRAQATANPLPVDPKTLDQGLDHYRENCVVCHGAPGVQRDEIGKGLNPDPPDLTIPPVRNTPDGQLFYIIQHGIRMTGMPAFAPTHSDREIWAIVAFVRHLPQLTPSEREELKKATAEEEEHHHQVMGDKEEKEEGEEH